MSKFCEICSVGKTRLVKEHREIEYKNTDFLVDFIYLLCDSCGSEYAGTIEIKLNKLAMEEVKKNV